MPVSLWGSEVEKGGRSAVSIQIDPGLQFLNTYLPRAPGGGGGERPSPSTTSLQIGEWCDMSLASWQIPVVLSHLSGLVV